MGYDVDQICDLFLQELRLTSKLRSEGEQYLGGNLLKDHEILQLNAATAARLLAQRNATTPPMHDPLRMAVFGNLDITKDDKKALNVFLRHVVLLLGNDPSAQGLSVEAAVKSWNALMELNLAAFSAEKVRNVLLDTVVCYASDLSVIRTLYDSFEMLKYRAKGRGPEPSSPRDDENQQGDSTSSCQSIEGLKEAASFVCGGPISYWTFVSPATTNKDSIENDQTTMEKKEVTEEDVRQASAEAFGGDKARVSNKEIAAKWVVDWVCKVSGMSQYDAEDTTTRIVMLLLNKDQTDESLAAEIFDLVGEGVFGHIEELLLQRQNLSQNIVSMIHLIQKETSEDLEYEKATPVYGKRFSIMSESEKQALKAERKAGRKRAKQSSAIDFSGENEAEFLSRVGIGVLVDFETAKLDEKNKIILGNGMEFRLGEGKGKQSSLPKGTVRNVYKGYEEVSVPPMKSKEFSPGEVLVQISELPHWAQLAFEGYESLNRIQSRIYPSAFFSNENLLVCAPTGAGKTNIAMTCILREIAQNMDDCGDIALGDFKVVYVAPMKALAAEMTYSFGKRLECLGVTVRELTGDMQLSKSEMESCQMIVTTPEKWDVITRKGGEVSITSKVRLLIIDEVHLLNEDRGSVIETIVARTTRQVESSQSMIRIVGLSATLPNYQDVAEFLGVNSSTGLFYFDSSYRPVPLATSFVGVSEKNFFARQSVMDEVCYQKVLDSLQRGHQAMVFVHSRKDTGKTARMLAMKAQLNGETSYFDCTNMDRYDLASKDAKKSKNKEMVEVFANGIGIHHAGMLRSDRTLMERFFSQGFIKVLCCTATLAWGVNLPAHTVIIKGTQLYIPQKGGFTDLGMLDVQQIFGRAGRPQFQDLGEASIITSHDKLAHYLGMITHAVPIESKFTEGLADHLNAEVVLGTVTNVREGIAWLGYTYLAVRMRKNPLAYGISWEEFSLDPDLLEYRRKLISEAARELDRARMVRFDERSGNIYTAEMGRVASHFYLSKSSIEVYNNRLKPHMNEEDIITMISMSSEFENINVRDDELPELDQLSRGCNYEIKGGTETKHGKTSVLLQTFVSREKLDSFSLMADLNYVSQNAPRLARALFEICLNKGWPSAAEMCLSVSKALEWRLWPHQHPLWQFESFLKPNLIEKIQEYGFDILQLKEMKADEIGAALRHPSVGQKILSAIENIPTLDLDAKVVPITRTVVRVVLTLIPDFKWRESVHGNSLRWFIWVEDSENERIYHSEIFNLTKALWREGKQEITFPVPVKEPLPAQYYVKAISESWIGCEATATVSFKGVTLPDSFGTHTELLKLDPLPKTALQNSLYESMYSFTHFNPIQTQAFYTLYHTDENVLLGAPTGSGKTISSELTLLRLFNAHKNRKAVFIAPLKALVKERMKDWSRGFAKSLDLNIVELTGDITPDLKSLLKADIIVTTPEKWDGISRNWQSRAYVRTVGLMIMDEIHLLGADRGPILEVIVSRMRYISAFAKSDIRFVGLSTALANASDLAGWLGVGRQGLFNFKPSVRPVPLECHIQGYPGKFYCPRMATMNKPAYAAIQTHSPIKPVLIFVASRRQTRLTALDLITYAAADGKPRTFLKIEDSDMEQIVSQVHDTSLRHTLQFGVGLHHAGLSEKDRYLVEKLFVCGQIQVLVATSTLAWGVNTPAHLVIIKGTEYFDAPTRRYVDYPITDVLQMMGRAGRPQFDKHGVAVIMVYEPKKSFYKKFLYEPFPVESSLHLQLEDHLNAEIASGTIESSQDCIDYLTWTFFLRRLMQNPSFYGLQATDSDSVSIYLSDLISKTLQQLKDAGCIEIDDESDVVQSTFLGQVASLYYLRYKTMKVFVSDLISSMDIPKVVRLLCNASEYEELPVRHNEDNLNAEMLPSIRFAPPAHLVDKPSCKAEILIQAHFSRLDLPVSDYITDTRTVLDNSMRILQAMIDIAADRCWWETCLSIMKTIQNIMQARWHDDNSLMQLPHINNAEAAHRIEKKFQLTGIQNLVKLFGKQKKQVSACLAQEFGDALSKDMVYALSRMPNISVTSQFCTQEKQFIEISVVRDKACSIKGVPKSFSPCFPKVKEESWWCAIVDGDKLIALKRFSFGSKAEFKIHLDQSPPLMALLHASRLPDVHLICDSYIGFDKQVRVSHHKK